MEADFVYCVCVCVCCLLLHQNRWQRKKEKKMWFFWFFECNARRAHLVFLVCLKMGFLNFICFSLFSLLLSRRLFKRYCDISIAHCGKSMRRETYFFSKKKKSFILFFSIHGFHLTWARIDFQGQNRLLIDVIVYCLRRCLTILISMDSDLSRLRLKSIHLIVHLNRWEDLGIKLKYITIHFRRQILLCILKNWTLFAFQMNCDLLIVIRKKKHNFCLCLWTVDIPQIPKQTQNINKYCLKARCIQFQWNKKKILLFVLKRIFSHFVASIFLAKFISLK